MPNDTDSVRRLETDATEAHQFDQNGSSPVDMDAAGSLLFTDDDAQLDGPAYVDAPFEGEFDEGGMVFDDEPLPGIGTLEGGVMVLDDPDHKRRSAQARQRRMSRTERRRRVRLQARRVRRIVRHIEPWSVLKISLLFYACLWLIFLVSGFMVWGVLDESGTIENFESLVSEYFVTDGEPFTLDANQVFRAYALIGLVLAIASTTFNVLMVLLFNLLSDLTGGLRITMIEEETARPTPPRRKRRRRSGRVPPPR